MTTLESARQTYYAASAKASDVARHLAYSGIAIIWIFSNASLSTVSDLLKWPALALACALAFDFLQYVWRAIVFGLFQWNKEKEFDRQKMTDEKIALQEFRQPRWFNWPTLVFFILKLLCVAAGYFLLLGYLVKIAFA